MDDQQAPITPEQYAQDIRAYAAANELGPLLPKDAPAGAKVEYLIEEDDPSTDGLGVTLPDGRGYYTRVEYVAEQIGDEGSVYSALKVFIADMAWRVESGA